MQVELTDEEARDIVDALRYYRSVRADYSLYRRCTDLAERLERIANEYRDERLRIVW